MKKNIVFLIILFLSISCVLYSQEKGVPIKMKEGNKGKRWAICIGIDDYYDNSYFEDLKKCRNDAKGLGNVLMKYGQFDRVYVMTDDLEPGDENYPTRMRVLQKMDHLKLFIDPGDLLIFSFSGHGILDSSRQGYLILVDSQTKDIYKSSLKVKDIVDWIKKMKIKKSLLLLDACRKIGKKGTKWQGLRAEKYEKAEVAAAFYATGEGDFSYEGQIGKYAVFTHYLIEGLQGMADSPGKEGNGDGIVSFSELASYVGAEVSKWASNNRKNQRPYIKIYGEKVGDLALSSYSGSIGPLSELVSLHQKTIPPGSLRSIYIKINPQEVNSMVKKRGFFEKYQNMNGDFPNNYSTETIAGNKVVIDHASGLMWHQSCAYLDDGRTLLLLEYRETKQWIRRINNEGFAGFSDWRLPTLEEAATLLESNKKDGGNYIDPAFSENISFIFTGDKSKRNSPWVVLINEGYLSMDEINGMYQVLPVRSIMK